MDLIRKVLKRIGFLKDNKHKYEYSNIHYSQEGEDIILMRYFNNKKDGFYVDIGAHHPKRFSNTNIFYQIGWRGINVDALPSTKNLFDKFRPEDINLEFGVSDKKGEMKYFQFNEPALNTFSEEEAKKKNGSNNGIYHLINTKTVTIKTLSEILDENLPKNIKIDFLTIDVEGLDLKVLQGNNWEKYCPEIILVEELKQNIESIIENSDVYKYLKNKNYQLFYRTFNTSFYKSNQ